MAHSVLKIKKNKIGLKVQRWLDEMNREFNGTLLPAPSINIDGTEVIDSRTTSDGRIRLEKIKFRIQQRNIMKSYEYYVQRFDASVGISTQCRWPACRKVREPTNTVANDSLYICEYHRRRMDNYFTKLCADNRVAIIKDYSPGDFEGYTALIELLEGAIRRISIVYQGGTEDNVKEGKLLQDALFNVRNFLITVCAMIKPNEKLLNSFLPHIVGITLKAVRTWGQYSIINLVGFIQHFLECILFHFGIINPWDSLFPESKPCVQIGSGLGGMIGVLSLFVVNIPAAVVAMSVGSLLGAVVGNRWYISMNRRKMFEESYCRYLTFRLLQQDYQDTEGYDRDLLFLSGSAYIDALLAVILIGQAVLLLVSP